MDPCTALGIALPALFLKYGIRDLLVLPEGNMVTLWVHMNSQVAVLEKPESEIRQLIEECRRGRDDGQVASIYQVLVVRHEVRLQYLWRRSGL